MDAATVMARADALGAVSEDPRLLVRSYGSPAMARANELVGGWMRDAGMEVWRDAVGNLIGRYDGSGPGTFLLGSHLDTVRDAGRYDGPLGVLIAVAAVERLHAREERLPFAVEIVGFADEEGLRFGTTYLGSSVFAGCFEPRLLDVRDADGTSLADAVRDFGGDPDRLADGGRGGDDVLGYGEVHIEQGPVLERRGLPVGVVSAIAGQSRIAVALRGEAGHAGTVPMAGRRDALCAAAELVLAVERTAAEEPGMVGTVGRLVASPGAGNVIPGAVELSIDLRHRDDDARRRALAALRAEAERLGAARGVEVGWEVRQECGAVPADPALSDRFAAAVEAVGVPVERLPSGAGHDAAAVAAVAPVAMLFVRCVGGVSHSPAEAVEEPDVGVALDVLERFLRGVDTGAGAGARAEGVRA
jgi:allantoate deiminase